MKTLKELIAEARAAVPEEGPSDLQRRLTAGEPVTIIDVRDPDEYREGHIEPATNISRGFLEFRIGSAVADSATPIVLYCQTGLRSVLAAKALQDLGYRNVINLQGGFQKWAQSGFPVVKDVAMTTEQIQRYSRHFLLNQVGEKGQRKLLRSKTLLIGAGGLGSPTALYLAAAGVGTLGLMDGDSVDITNLQRQILHTTADIGKPKVESGTRTLKALNPDVNIVSLPTRITVDNVMDIHPGLRPRRGRLGQFRDALPRERRLLSGRQDQRPRIDLSVRGNGLCLCAQPGARAIAASIRRHPRRASYPPEARLASWACSQE